MSYLHSRVKTPESISFDYRRGNREGERKTDDVMSRFQANREGVSFCIAYKEKITSNATYKLNKTSIIIWFFYTIAPILLLFTLLVLCSFNLKAEKCTEALTMWLNNSKII